MSSVRHSKRDLFAVAVLVVIGLAVRWMANSATWPTPLINDELYYYFGPLGWLYGDEPFDATRPPAMRLMVAAVMEMGVGLHPGFIRRAGVVLGSVLVLLVYLVGRQVGGRRSALVAAAITAVYPTLVGFSHYVYSETLFLVFALLALWLTMRQHRRLSLAEVACAGVLCGLSALTRDVGVTVTGGLALVIVWFGAGQLRQRILAAALLTSLALVTIAPWSFHIHRATGGFGLVSRTSWMNLYIGNPAPGRFATMAQYLKFGKTLNEREAKAQRRVLAAIGQRMPGWPFEKLKILLRLFQPTSFPVRRLLAPPGQLPGEVGVWRYEFSWPALGSPGARSTLAFLAAASYVGVAVVGFAGLVLCRRRAGAITLWIFTLSFLVPTIMVFSNTRFRLPVEPVLIVGFAIAVCEGRELWRSASLLRRTTAAAFVVAMSGLMLWQSEAWLSPTAF